MTTGSSPGGRPFRHDDVLDRLDKSIQKLIDRQRDVELELASLKEKVVTRKELFAISSALTTVLSSVIAASLELYKRLSQ